MRPGSVIVDLASDAGGNCAATHPGQSIATHERRYRAGLLQLARRIPVARRRCTHATC